MTGSTLILLALGATGGAVAFLLFHASPRLTFLAWAVTLYLVPVWIGVNVGFFWSAITLVTLMALAVNIRNLHLVLADAIMLLFVVSILALFAFNMATVSATVIALLEWCIPYIWGRVALGRIGAEFLTSVIAVLAVFVAALAILEFFSGWNPFTSLPAMSPDLYAEWGSGQLRAGRLRAEGAWGHSIALGAALSMSSSFVIAVRWPNAFRILGLAVIAAGTVVTLSRIGIVTLGLTVVLSILFLPHLRRSLRIGLTMTAVAVGAVAVPFVKAVLFQAGDEAAGSADYRSQLFSLVRQLRPFGGSADWSAVIDDVYLGSFARSIDNAVLLFALRFGWIPALFLLLILVLAAARALRRSHSSPAAVSVAAQVPTLFVVALITQFGMMLWFLAGLALSGRQVAPSGEGGDEVRGRLLNAGLVPPRG